MKAVKEKPQSRDEIRKSYCNCFMDHTKFLQPLNKFYETTKSYVLNHFTILDIIFYEACFYAINMFEDMHEIYPIFVSLKCFKIRFEQEDFFIKNKDKLNSYCILCSDFPKEELEFFKSIWKGDDTQVQECKIPLSQKCE